MENKSAKKRNVVYTIVIIVSLAIMALFSGYKINKLENKIEELENSNNELLNENKDLKDNISDLENYNDSNSIDSGNNISKEKKLIVSNTIDGENEYKVELTTDGKIIINSDILKDKVVETNVSSAYVLYCGKSDTGDGRVVLMIKNDGSISAFLMEYLTIMRDSWINNESDFDKQFTLVKNLSSFHNVITAYNEKVDTSNEYESSLYKVIIEDVDHNKTDITNYIK